MTEFKRLLYSRKWHLMIRHRIVFESKENSKISNELAKVINQVESDFLDRRTSQLRIKDFLFSKIIFINEIEARSMHIILVL